MFNNIHKSKLSNIQKYGILNFLLSLSFALIVAVWAIYIDSFLKDEAKVSMILFIFGIVAFLSYFLYIELINKYKEKNILIWSLIIIIFSLIFFSLNDDFYVFLIIASIFSIATTLRIQSSGLIARDLSDDKTLAENEGFLYTILNIGWLLAPMIVAITLLRYHVNMIFLLASFILMIAVLVIYTVEIPERKAQKNDKALWKNLNNFVTNKKIILAYILKGILDIWWAIIYIYIPLYMLNHLQTTEFQVGLFLFFITIPLIFLELPISRSLKKTGFKNTFLNGYVLLTIMIGIAFYMEITNSFNIISLTILFFIANIGAAFLEPTLESYFFSILNPGEEERFYGPYCSSYEFFPMIAKLFFGISLIFFPFSALLLIMFFILLFGAYMVKYVVEKKHPNIRGKIEELTLEKTE